MNGGFGHNVAEVGDRTSMAGYHRYLNSRADVSGGLTLSYDSQSDIDPVGHCMKYLLAYRLLPHRSDLKKYRLWHHSLLLYLTAGYLVLIEVP